MSSNSVPVVAVDEDFIKIELGSELADMILCQLLRHQAQVIFKCMQKSVTDIYEDYEQSYLWEDLQHALMHIAAINVLLEYYGQPQIDLPAEMERLSK